MMINKVIRRIDKQGRLQLPNDLIKFSSIFGTKEIAMCSMGNKMIKLKRVDDIKNCKAFFIIKMDEKGRIIIPLEIRQETEYFEIFLFNGDLIIKEALN